MKQIILDTHAGRIAMFIRDKLELLNALFFKPSDLHTILNDKLASYLMTRFCQPNKIFIDIGAHIGSVISEVHYNVPTASIIAFEAMPDKAKNLQKKFPYAKIFSCALGEESGSISFYVNTRLSGYSSMIKPNSAIEGEYSTIVVEVGCLDNHINSKDVDVIKIDVEGSELGVLRGSLALLNDSRPLIMFESGPETNGESNTRYTKAEMFDFFQRIDYSIVIPNRLAHNDPGLKKDCFIESHLYPRRTTNYFGVPNERRTEIRDRARDIFRTV